MSKCEHFIYTAGKIDSREGYQVIAKSQGVSDELTQTLREYMYPLGMNVEEFKKSKSLLLLGDLVVYSIVKNIGIGFDGRRGTLYNHTFIMKKEEFEKLNFDSRLFDQYFIEDDSIRGQLDVLDIQNQNISPNFDLIKSSSSEIQLRLLIHGLLKNQKIAIVSDDIEIIQNILSLLPIPYRLIPFSTLVIEPKKQHKFHLMAIPDNVITKLSRTFLVIEPTSKITRNKEEINEISQPFIDIIQDGDKKELDLLFDEFNTISKQISKTRRIKLKEIFNESDYDDLVKSENLNQLKEKVRKLFSSRKFNQASPNVMLSITKKIRKIINKLLKQQKKKKESLGTRDKAYLSEIVTILLNSMNFVRYSNKRTSPSILSQISLEITQLESLLDDDVFEKENIQYIFDPMATAKFLYDQTVRNGQMLYRLFFGN